MAEACSACESRKETISITSPADYYEVVRRAQRGIADGSLLVVAGDYELGDIKADKVWPSDIIRHTFTCAHCGQRFSLEVETYHGSGGAWKAVD